MKDKALSLQEFMDSLQMRGKYSFSLSEVPESIYKTRATLVSMIQRFIKQGRLFSPYKKFYTIVPTEYKSSGSIPALWYIDDLMKHLKMPYYVALLSAAHISGSGHQQPQALHVITAKPLKEINKGHVRIVFSTKTYIHNPLLRDSKAQTGYFKISSPALTTLDLIRYVETSGYFNNIATVIYELTEDIKVADLREALDAEAETRTIQRLGYLFEFLELKKLAEVVEKWLKDKSLIYIPLARYTKDQSMITDKNHKWKILVNTEIETDI